MQRQTELRSAGKVLPITPSGLQQTQRCVQKIATGIVNERTALPELSPHARTLGFRLEVALEKSHPTSALIGLATGIFYKRKGCAGYTRPMMEAVAINSSSRLKDTLPDTEYGSSSGFSAYLRRMLWLILDMLTCPIVHPPNRRSVISS